MRSPQGGGGGQTPADSRYPEPLRTVSETGGGHRKPSLPAEAPQSPSLPPTPPAGTHRAHMDRDDLPVCREGQTRAAELRLPHGPVTPERQGWAGRGAVPPPAVQPGAGRRASLGLSGPQRLCGSVPRCPRPLQGERRRCPRQPEMTQALGLRRGQGHPTAAQGELRGRTAKRTWNHVAGGGSRTPQGPGPHLCPSATLVGAPPAGGLTHSPPFWFWQASPPSFTQGCEQN